MGDDRTVPVLGGKDRQVWIAAIVLYGIGDTVTTFWGISVGGIAEAGPIAGPLIEEYGRSALIGIKAVVFPVFYILWRLLRTPGRIAVPFALAFVGGVVTAWNLLVIANVL
ncbi:MAG: DUF5658 family protein [Natronomonas sp.]